MPIELHCHSTASDGDYTPAQLVERAIANGLTTLAITDHDTVDGIPEALEAARPTSLRVITGVELSCHFEDGEVHLLGYLFEHRDPDFLELLESLKAERRSRVLKILKKLEERDVTLSFQEVEAAATGGALGRPHVARALQEAGHVESFAQAFDLYIGNRAPCYVGRTLLSLERGIEAVRRAGGVPVLAHPGVYNDWPMVERIMQLPVQGVEAWHPSHKKSERKRAKKLGGRYNKVLTGGSDFHGTRGDFNELGSAPLKEKVVTRLLEVREAERLSV